MLGCTTEDFFCGISEGVLVVLCFGGYQATLCRPVASMFAGAGLDAQASPEGTQESPTQINPMGSVLPVESKADGHLAHRAPLCKGHLEPCVRKRVNKSGPNKGLLLPATPQKGAASSAESSHLCNSYLTS